jgi:hypothetical protein
MSHTYSTDSAERRYVPFFVAAAAIGSALLVDNVLDKYHVSLPRWASPLDTMAFYGLFYTLFDKYLWKWSVLRKLRITKVPDLAGTWRGYVEPARTTAVSPGLAVKTDITIEVQQTWRSLFVVGRTQLSKSHSLSGSVIINDESSISYEYLNEPSAHALYTMHAHRGTARLSIDKTQRTMEGEYYSGRDRQNIGTIHLTKSAS